MASGTGSPRTNPASGASGDEVRTAGRGRRGLRPYLLGRFGLRARIMALLAVLVLLVTGGTALAVTMTVKRWIYSNAQSMVHSQFDSEMAQLDREHVPQVGRSELYALFAPSTDLTALHHGDLVTLGSAKPEQIPEDFVTEVAADNRSHARRIGTHHLLLGQTITLTPWRGGEQSVQVLTVRALPGVRDKITQLFTVVGVSFALGALLCLGIGAWWSAVLIQPLRRLDAGAHKAANGDLTVRLPTSDVPELAQVTRTFNHMIERHAATLAQLNRFVADVSHELRTPLAAMVPTAEILDDESDSLPPDAAQAAAVLSSEITNLVRLVEDLMEISRHDARTATLDIGPTDIRRLLTEALRARNWADHVAVLSPSEAVIIEADERRLEVALTNIIGNALKHGAQPVSVALKREGSQVEITVTDAGPGIPPEHLDKIFARFYKADTARHRSHGSGLGLALASEHIRLHSGTLSVRSRPGRTTFTVTLQTRQE